MIEFIDTIFLYARLIAYPLMVYTLLVYAWAVLADKNRDFAHAATVLSVVFAMLWGSSIVFFITKDLNIMYDFASFGLVPILIISIIYLWIKIIKNIRELRQKKVDLKLKVCLKEVGDKVEIVPEVEIISEKEK